MPFGVLLEAVAVAVEVGSAHGWDMLGAVDVGMKAQHGGGRC